jgi:hypothetical protein
MINADSSFRKFYINGEIDLEGLEDFWLLCRKVGDIGFGLFLLMRCDWDCKVMIWAYESLGYQL